MVTLLGIKMATLEIVFGWKKMVFDGRGLFGGSGKNPARYIVCLIYSLLKISQ